MKILWLSPLFPYPLFSGGQTRAYNLLRNLARKNEITLFSFWRPGRIQGPVEEMKKFCVKIDVFEGRPIWTVRNVLLAGFSHLPFAITHFWGDQRVKTALGREIKKGKYDLIHFESFYTSPYLRTDFDIPTVLGNENVEHRLYQRFAQKKRILPLKLLLNYDVWKMEHYEQAAWKRADLNLMVAGVDAQEVEKATGRKCLVIPNGVDVRHFKNLKSWNSKRGIKTLLFVGDFKYFANQEAISFLIKEIWPIIKRKAKVRLRLVGRNASQSIKDLVSDDVVVDEGVGDIRQAYKEADVFVAPMQQGSGTNIKILEAMASKLPVVTTSVGIEGIEAKDGKEAVVCDNAEGFANEVVELLNRRKRSQEFGRAGQALVTKLYDWPKITRKLEKAYEELIGRRR